MKRVKDTDFIYKKGSKSGSLCLKEIGVKLVDLYPIVEDAKIPKEALDPNIWDIPEGYYAVEVKNVD